MPTGHAQNDPDLKGEFGSNKTPAELPMPEPGDAGEPWSHYLNPGAHPGVKGYILDAMGMPIDEGGGIGDLSFGETLPDEYRLRPIPGKAKLAPYDSDWSTKTWDVGSFTYRRRRVTLPSGASLVIFAPMNPPPPPCTEYTSYYDRDALYVPRGYQGNQGFEIRKNPPAWSSDPSYADPYDDADWMLFPFGYEIEIGGNYEDRGADVDWIREGSVEHEALERGMTLVIVHASLGSRPILTHIAQLVEADKWMGSCYYAKSCQQFPTPSTYRHRNFIKGGSYAGGVARIAATYLPWLFRGGISISGGVDMHAFFAWQQAYELMQQQILGIYPGGFIDTYDLWDADVQSLFRDLERGYAGDMASSIAGVPVDVAGMGLFAWDLGLFDNEELVVPLVLAHGDEDQGQYSFFGRDLETDLTLGSSLGWSFSQTGPTCGGGFVPYTGVIVERRAPNLCHSGIERWNEAEHMAGSGLLDILLDEVALQPVAPIPFSAANTSGDVEWSVRATGDDPDLARTFRDELSRPKVTEMPPAAFGDFDPGDVTEVTGGDWKELGEVCEGLGMPNSVVLADLNGDGDLELVAGTARGDVVKLQLVTNGSGYVQSVDFKWRARVSDYFAGTQATDYLGPSEVILDGTSNVIVAHTFGPIWMIDASSDTLPAPQDVALLQGNLPAGGHAYGAGAWLRGLGRKGSMYFLVNDEGELIEFDTAGTLNRYFLEGGAGPVELLGGGNYLYASAHGNVMRTDPTMPPAHPKPMAEISEHLYGIPRILRKLLNPVGAGVILAWTDHLILLDDDLAVVGQCPERSPDGLREAGPGTFVGFWKRVPPALALQEQYPLQLRLPVVAAFQVDGGGQIAYGDFVRLPAPATALVPYPGPGTSTAVPTFPVKWLATLQTGQVALVGELSTAGSADLSDTQLAIYREAYGNTFGMVTLDQANAQVIAAGPESQGWTLDVDEDTDVLQGAPQPNLFHPGKQSPWAPHRGAVVVGGDLYGLPDGGEAYQDGALVAMPFSSPFTQQNVIDDMKDPLNVEAGVMVVDVTMTADDPATNFMGYDAIQNALWCSTYIEDGLCTGLVGQPSALWKSTILTSDLMVGSVEDTGFILRGFGNACRWADLDGNGTQDLVAATHGGRVVWFENLSSGATPDLPSGTYGAPTGELVYRLAQPPVDLGWDGDLGTTMMAMEIANLDDASDDEVLVGTFFDVDPANPEHYRLGGSVYAIGKMTGGSDSLEVLDSIPLDYGVCGLHVMPYVVYPTPPMTGPARRYVAAGTARGRIHVLEYDPARMAGDRFHVVYRSRFYAPMAGAYNAIRSFPISGPTGREYRVVFGSSGGILAFDITMPADFTP